MAHRKSKDKATFDRCVEKTRGKVRNPHAVCNAAGAGRKRKRSKR